MEVIPFLKSTYLVTDFVKSYLVAQMVKNLPVTWETQIRSLGEKNPLEKELATQSSILAWRIPWREEPGTVHRFANRWTRDRKSVV